VRHAQVRRYEVRAYTQCLAECGDCLVALTRCLMEDPEVVQVPRIIRIESRRFANKRYCGIVVPGLVGDKAQTMQRLGVIRVGRQYLLVQCLGLAQAAALVVLLRRMQQTFDVESVCVR